MEHENRDAVDKHARERTGSMILSHWHEAILAFRKARPSEYGEHLFRKLSAERDAIDYFGLGDHREAYDRQYRRVRSDHLHDQR